MKQFNLGHGSLGNGISVWNTKKEVNGDYEKVAHISIDGLITFYIKNLPDHVIEEINSINNQSEFEYRGVLIRKHQSSVTQGNFFILDISTKERITSYSMQLPNPITNYLMNDQQIKQYLDLHYFVD